MALLRCISGHESWLYPEVFTQQGQSNSRLDAVARAGHGIPRCARPKINARIRGHFPVAERKAIISTSFVELYDQRDAWGPILQIIRMKPSGHKKGALQPADAAAAI
jgi:hypothetical protein